MSRWFRFYDMALDDPKVQRLPCELFKAWVNLLCLASRNAGRLPDLADVAFALRLSEEAASGVVDLLASAELLDLDDDGYAPHNWKGRQFSSDNDDTAVERQRRKRERDAAERLAREASQNVTRDTSQESHAYRTDTDTDTDTSLRSVGGRARESTGKPKPKASRIPSDWQPDAAAATALGVPDGKIPKIGATFRDYWLGQPPSKSVKADWAAVWRNWCRRECEKQGWIPPPEDGATVTRLPAGDWIDYDTPEWRDRTEACRKQGKVPPFKYRREHDGREGNYFPAEPRGQVA